MGRNFLDMLTFRCLAVLLAVAATDTLAWAETAPAAASGEAELARLGDQFSDLYNAGRYREAIAVVERALAIRKRQVGDAHPDIGNLLVKLGELHRLAGDLKEVEPYRVYRVSGIDF